MDSTRLVVGLGNPGPEYARTRHNVGFMVVDELAARLGAGPWRTKHRAKQAPVPQRRALLLAPQSYMNESGDPVLAVASYYRTQPADILVISDDMDLPFGKLRMRAQGGHGGHNGLRSIIEALGNGFPRLRLGVGRPAFDAVDHVLSRFDDTESKVLPTVVAAAADAVEVWLTSGSEAAMQMVNRWTLPVSSSSPPSL